LLFASTLRSRARRFDNADRSIDVNECLIRHATNILFGDFVDPLNGPEQFAPIAVAGLVRRQLR
jgi:hypothetical protein